MMEGGEAGGVVAIVHGLQNAGLAVTLLRRGHLQTSVSRNKKILVTKSSVDTSSQFKIQKTSTSVQICNGHYTSSYQLAHCGFIPTSPVETLSEYPLQRLRPSRSKGNFDVQGMGSGETMCCRGTTVPVFKRSRINRGNPFPTPPPTSPRGLFVDSLRKYSITLSPGRSVSSELVQRLLDYTQAKHLSKHNTHSLRSLQNKTSRQSKDSKDKRPIKNNKAVETYTQAFSKVLSKTEKLVKERRKAKRAQTEETGREQRKSCMKTSQTDAAYKKRSSNSHTRCKLDQLSETYNYLKYGARHSGHSSEVRYLNDVKQYLRDSLRQMVDSSTSDAVCPMIKNRYSHHRRLHHQRSIGTTHSDIACASVQAGQTEEDTRRKKSVSVGGETSPIRTCDLSNICPKLRSCLSQHMKRNSSVERTESEDEQEQNVEEDESEEECNHTTCPNLQNRLTDHRKDFHSDTDTDDEISICPTLRNCLNHLWKTGSLPRWVDPDDENICPYLRSRMSDHRKADHSDEAEFDEESPGWEEKDGYHLSCKEMLFPSCRPPPGTVKICSCPCKKTDKSSDTQTDGQCGTTESVDQLYGTSESDARSYVSDARSRSTIGSIARSNSTSGSGKYRDRLSDADELMATDAEKEILNWLEDLPSEATEMLEKTAQRLELVKPLVTKLNDLLGQNDFEDKSKEEIGKFVDSLPLKYPKDKKETARIKDQYTKDLFKKLFGVDYEKPNLDYNVIMTEWLDEIGSNLQIKNQKNKRISNDKLVKIFANHLKPILNRAHTAEELQEEISKILPKPTAAMGPNAKKEMEEIAQKLVSRLIPIVERRNEIKRKFSNKTENLRFSNAGQSEGRKRKSRSSKDNTEDSQSAPLTNWLEDAPNVPKKVKEQNKKIFQKFDQKLNDMKSKNAADDVMEKEVDGFLNSLPEKGVPILSAQRRQLTQNIMKEMKPANKNRRQSRASVQPVSNWLENAPNIPKEVKEKNKNAFRKFDQKLKDMQSKNTEEDVVEEEIGEFLNSLPEKGVSLPPNQRRQLTQKIMNEMKSMQKRDRRHSTASTKPVSEWLENAANVSEEVKEKNQQAFKKFDQKLKDMQSTNTENDIMEEEIDGFLKSLAGKGVSLPPSQRRQVARKILNEMKNMPDRNITPSSSSKSESAWLENAENIPTDILENNKEAFKKFAQKLEVMKSKNIEDDVIEEEIDNFLKSLPEKGAALTPAKRRQLARKIMNEMKPTSKEGRKKSRSGADLAAKGPNATGPVPKEIKEKNKQAFKKFEQKLRVMHSKNTNADIMEVEVDNFLKLLPEKGEPLPPTQRRQLARTIVNEVKFKPQREKIHSPQPISNWLEDEANISQEIKEKNKQAFKKFDQKLKDMQSKNTEDDIMEEEIDKFLKMLPEKGIQLPPAQRRQLAQKIIREMKSMPKAEKRRTSPSAELLSNWLEDAPNIPKDVKEKNKQDFKKFDQKLKDLQSQNADDDEVAEEIDNFLKSLSGKGAPLQTDQKRQLAQKIKSEMKSMSKADKKQSTLSAQPLSNWLEDAPNVTKDIKEKNKQIFKKFDQKLKDMQSQNANNEAMEKEIGNFLNSLPEKGVPLPPTERRQVTEKIMNEMKSLPKRDKRQSSPRAQPLSSWLEGASNVPKDVKEKNKQAFKKFDQKLKDMQSQNTEDDVMEKEIDNFLKSIPEKGVPLPLGQRRQLAQNIMREMKSIPKADKKQSSPNAQPFSNWLEDTPNVPKDVKEKNKQTFKKFDQKIEDIQSQNTEDQSQNAADEEVEEEIDNFLRSLPEKGISIPPNQKQQLAQKMMDEIKSLPKVDKIQSSPTAQPLSNWLENAPNISKEVKEKNKQSFKKFDQNLKDMQSRNAEDNVMEEELQNFLKSLPEKGVPLPPDQRHQLAQKIMNEMKSIPKGDNKQSSSRNQPLSNVLENAPNVPKEVKDKNKQTFKKFDQKLKEMQSQNTGDDVIEEEIDKVLKSLPEKGVPLPAVQRRQKITDEMKPMPKVDKKQSSPSTQPVSDWLENLETIPKKAKQKHKHLAKKFDQKLINLQTENASHDVIEKEIEIFLRSLSKEGIHLTPVQKDQLSNNVQQKANPKQRRRWDKNEKTQPVIADEISDLINHIPTTPEKRKIIKEQIADLLSSDIQNLPDSKVKSHIKSILKKDDKIPPKDIPNIASALTKTVKSVPSSFADTQRPTTNEIKSKDAIDEDVKSILDDYDLPYAQLDRIARDIANALKDQKALGANDDDTKKMIVSILDKNANVAQQDAQEISERLVKRNAEKLRGPKDNLPFSKKPAIPNSMEKQILEKNISKAVLDFVANKTGDHSPEARKKRTKAAAELTENLSNTVSDPNNQNKEESMMSEISRYIERSSISTNEPKEELVKQLMRSLQNFQISTPKKRQSSPPTKKSKPSKAPDKKSKSKRVSHSDDTSEAGDDDISKLMFYPQDEPDSNDETEPSDKFGPKSSSKSSKPTNFSDEKYDDDYAASSSSKSADLSDSESATRNAEEKYMKALKEAIKSWMDETPLDLDDSYSSGFKDTMVDDLAGDIIDRQKYLQLSPNTVTSPKEELEQLKYQVYKWLNKLVDVEGLSSVMPEIPALMDKIKNVSIPQLVGGQRFSDRQNAKSAQKNIPSIIKTWIDGMDPNLLSPDDKSELKTNVSEIADAIKRLQSKNEIDDTENILDEISPFITSVNEDIEESDLYEMAENLKSMLNSRDTSGLGQDNKEMEENLAGALQDWLKDQPLYQRRNSNDKRAQERIMKELAKGLIPVFERSATQGDVDKDLIDEIRKHVEQFPMDEKFKSDKRFMDDLLLDILDYLKNLQLFQNISRRRDSQDNSTRNIVRKWIDSLPLYAMNSSEKYHFDELKDDFIARINQIRQSEPSNKAWLREEIKSFLENIPIKLENVREHQVEKYLNELSDDLIDSLIPQPHKTTLPIGSNDFIKNAVAQWVKTLILPEPDDLSTFEYILNKAQNDLISKLSNLFVYAEEVPLKNIKNLFEDLTSKFLEQLPVNPYNHEEMEILADSLLDTFKEYSKKYPITPSPKKKPADVLLDDIADWVKNLPIEADTPEKKEQADKIKQQVESKLIHKIGELNMNPEVLNDDFLYEDLLNDEIDDLLTNIPSKNIQDNLPALKKDLMDKVKEARQKIREENAGQVYKQQLREAISKTLPFQNLSVDEQASFEVLKDDVADAFINLHYVGYDEEQIEKLQDKINNEINKFSNDYLRKHPSTPINSTKLNEDLYNALKNVSEPNNESFRDEVELLKIKDIVNDWAKELPFREPTGQDKLQVNKMMSVLAKKLHDIEIEKEWIPDADHKMKKEIIKFMKKLPLLVKTDESIDWYAEKLLNELKNTEKTRRLDVETRNSIELDLDCYDCMPAVPPCVLSAADRAHLENIRQRIPRARLRFIPKISSTDAESTCTGTCSGRPPALGQRSIPPRKTQAPRSQTNVSPRVMIKNHYWDSVDDSSMSTCAPYPCPPLQKTCSQTAPKPCLVTSRPSSYGTLQGSTHKTRSCGSQYQIPCRPKPCLPRYQSQYKPTCRRDQNFYRTQATQAENYVPPPRCQPPVIPCPIPEPKTAPQKPCLYSDRFTLPCPGPRHYVPPNQRESQNSIKIRSRPCIPPPPPAPCAPPYKNQPYVSPRSSPLQPGPCAPQQRIPCVPSPRRSCYTRQDPPVSSEDYEMEPSCSFKPQVTRLGSFDHDVDPNICERYHIDKCPMSNDEYCWERDGNRQIYMPCDDGYMDRDCRRPRRSFRARPIARCTRRSYQMSSIKNCSRCCGMHCAHPTYMYFRR